MHFIQRLNSEENELQVQLPKTIKKPPTPAHSLSTYDGAFGIQRE